MADWGSAGFEGSRDELLRGVARTSSMERFAWLAAARRHAAATGALQAEVERRSLLQAGQWELGSRRRDDQAGA